MLEFFASLFNSREFTSIVDLEEWSRALVWVHVVSAVAIWAAFTTTLIALNYFILRRETARIPRRFWVFEAFLFVSGTLFVLQALVVGWPVYRFYGLLLATTAVLSWAAVILLIPVIPRVLALRRPEELAREIAERKKAEETLRVSEQRFRTMAETMPTMVAIFQGTGHVYVNPAFERILGYSREELMNRSFIDYVHPDFRQIVVERSLARQRGETVPSRYEIPLVTKDGRNLWFDFSAAVIEFEGRPAVLGISIDITQRKEMEGALRRAIEAAEAANRAKSTFLANMSHEIRTPMNAVLGMTDLVLETELTGDQRQNLETARDSAESLLAIINDILDFSKIEAGKLDLEQTPFALRDCVEDTLRALAIRAHGKGIELACRLHPGIPAAVSGDRARLRQILVNLVGNAIKFTARGEVVMDVSAAEPVDGQVELHFTVSDTGIGIPADKLSSIFCAFEQVDPSTTRRYGGTGLGLAIASRLVELMGGRIWVESRLNEGSSFHFTARFGHADPRNLPVPPIEPVEIEGTRALVVDDNATNRRILEEILRNWGMRPRSAGGAAEAFELLHEAVRASDPFRVVLSDVNMPVADGFSLVERCRADPTLRDCAFVMLTSATRSGDADRCRQLAVKAHLVKPVKQSELYDSITDVLGIPAAGSGAAPGSAEVRFTRPLRILLVEDSLANQRLAIGLLQKWGHEVVLATNGREAVAAAASDGRLDLILMDVQMPEMDGFEATRRIREDGARSGRPSIPIIAMTAHAMKGDRERCLDAGMDGYVSKPVRAAELSRTIAQFVRSETAAAKSPSDAPGGGPPGPLRSPALIDWSVARESVAGDTDLLRAIAAAALDEWPGLTVQLRRAIDTREFASVGRVAHTFRSAFRTLGARHAADLAERLEAAAGRDQAVSFPFTDLIAAIEAVSAELATFIGAAHHV